MKKTKKKLSIFFAAAEATPIVQAGGLGDVVGSLPKALVRLGIDVALFLPRYASIAEGPWKQSLVRKNIAVPFNDKMERFNLWRTTLPETRIPVYIIDNKKFIGGGGIYWEGEVRKESRPFSGFFRFAFFSRAIPEAIAALGAMPDLIHLHDSHAAPAPIFLKKKFGGTTPPTLLTIHNLAYQGRYPQKYFEDAFGNEVVLFPKETFLPPDGSRVNIFLSGILTANWISTVSPSYRNEVLMRKHGEGLDWALKKRAGQFSGILNGIDTENWDPARDPSIVQTYGLNRIAAKLKNKMHLKRALDLGSDPSVFVLGMASRLTEQKGFKILIPAIPKILSDPRIEIIILASGSREYAKALSELQRRFPKQLAFLDRFDAALAHKIYAGSDAFLMPSRFEPCGLGQMIAMRYGTVPIVRATGGLKDTVYDWRLGRKRATGFVFSRYAPETLLAAVLRAHKLFRICPEEWRRLQENGMREDFSWDASARQYRKLYEHLVRPSKNYAGSSLSF